MPSVGGHPRRSHRPARGVGSRPDGVRVTPSAPGIRPALRRLRSSSRRRPRLREVAAQLPGRPRRPNGGRRRLDLHPRPPPARGLRRADGGPARPWSDGAGVHLPVRPRSPQGPAQPSARDPHAWRPCGGPRPPRRRVPGRGDAGAGRRPDALLGRRLGFRPAKRHIARGDRARHAASRGAQVVAEPEPGCAAAARRARIAQPMAPSPSPDDGAPGRRAPRVRGRRRSARGTDAT